MNYESAFARSLSRGIPPLEAANFFVRVKQANWADPPDETGQLEGQFAAPMEQVLLKLTEVISAKFKLMVAYHVYAESMRDPAQHGIGEVFHEHAEMERAAAEAYLKRAAALGGPVHLPEIETPPASSDPIGILKIIVRAEQEAIALQAALKSMVGDLNPLSFQIEQFMIEDQHHHDEAWQMLPQETTPAPVLGVGGEDPAAAGVPAGMGAPPPPPEPGLSEGAPPPPPAPAASPPPAKPASKPEPKPAPKEEKTASAIALRFRAGLHKLGFSPTGVPEAPNDPGAAPTPDQQNMTVPQPSMAAPGPQPPMATPPGARQYEGTNYLEAESVARRAQSQNESQFYQQQAQQAQQGADETAGQLQQIQGQLDQLQSQVDESQNQVMAAQQEAVTANDQMLNQATLAARMRMGMQQLRAQMMEIASQDPEQLAAAAGGPTPMDVGNQAAQAQQGPAALPAGDPGAAQAGADPSAIDPTTGQPAAEPGAEPGTPAAAPDAQAQQGSVPSGAGGSENKSAPEPKEDKGDKGGETTVSIKKGSAPVMRMKVADTLGQEFAKKLPYMAAGALAGGVGAVRQGSDKRVTSLREQVDALKGQQDGGFAKSLELAKAHMSLSDAENAKQHPYRAALKGGLAGAGLGAAVGTAVPAIMSQGQRLRGNLQTLQGLA